MPKTETNELIDQVWNPPSDRVLIMKAKVKTGWSSRSSLQQIHKNPAQLQISDSEFIEIENVMRRAALVEKKELTRINKLYDRYNYINKPKGSGNTSCIVCGSNFGSFKSTPRICSMCLKNCCSSCCVDTINTINSNKQVKWLCKICSEYYEFLKKSGAWFHNRLQPVHIEDEKTIICEEKVNNINNVVTMTVSKNSLSSSNSCLNEETIISRKISKTSINDEIEVDDGNGDGVNNNNEDDDDNDNEEDVRSLNSFSSNLATSHISSSNSNNNLKKPKAFDNSSISGASDNLSIADTRSHMTESNLNIDAMGKCSRSSSTKDITKVANAEEDFKEDSIDIQFQKYAPLLQKISINEEDIMTSTKYEEHQNVPNSPPSPSLSSLTSSPLPIQLPAQIPSQMHKKRLSAFKSKLTLKHPTTNSNNKNKQNDNQDKDTFLGTIKFSVLYNSTLQQLSIHLTGASNLPARDSNGLSDPYVKIHLLPSLAKSTKLRSKTIYKSLNPEFHETLTYGGISITDLDTKTLRLTVLDEDKIGFDYIGEYRVPLKSIQIDEINEFDVKLEEIKELGDDLDTHFRGKINFALKYSKLTQTLFVKIIRCTQLLPMDNGRSSDPFVQIALTPLEKSNKHKQRTSVKWKTLDPEYMEEFKFPNLDLKTLLSKTIEISVWDKDFTSNDFIGIVKLSENVSGDELTHYYTMIKNPDLYHEQWHTLKLEFE